MKLKIVSDGTFEGTKVIDKETGQTINQISMVEFQVDINGLPKATIEFTDIEVDIISPTIADRSRFDKSNNYVKSNYVGAYNCETHITHNGGYDTKISNSTTKELIGGVQFYYWAAATHNRSNAAKIEYLEMSPLEYREFPKVVEPKKKSALLTWFEGLFSAK